MLREIECHLVIGRDFRKASTIAEQALTLFDALGINKESEFHLSLSILRAEVQLQKTEYTDAKESYREILGDSQMANPDTIYPLFALLDVAHIDAATMYGDRSTFTSHWTQSGLS